MMSNGNTPVKQFHLQLSDLTYTGHDLVRPEAILALPDGTLWVTDGQGGLTRIVAGGQQKFFKGLGGEPNALAMAGDGSMYVVHARGGAVQKLLPDGKVIEFLKEADGITFTYTNFVFIDGQDRLWISVSTRDAHWLPAVVHPRPDGYIVLFDGKTARLVADGIYFTNEVRLDAREEYLYVAESMKRHMLRFPVEPDGSLGDKEIFGPADLGAYIHGFAFDAEGNIWVALILRNGVGIITPDGHYHVVLEEPDEDHLAAFETKIERGTLESRDVFEAAGQHLKLITSITFGGPDLQTVYLGSLRMDCLPTFRSPIPGLPMRHWR